MGYGVAPTLLQAVCCKAALQMALEALKEAAGKALIHHSDRGIQYCSAEYVNLLESYQIRISMTENGDPLENAGPDADLVCWSIAERINGIIRNEYLAHQPVTALAQAQEALLTVESSIRSYNMLRPHMSCSYLHASLAHQSAEPLVKHWKSKPKKPVPAND